MNSIKKSPSTPFFYLLSGGGGPGGPAPCCLFFFFFFNVNNNFPEMMRCRLPATLLLIVLVSLFLFASFALYSTRVNPNYGLEILYPPANLTTRPKITDSSYDAVREDTGLSPTRPSNTGSDSDSVFSNLAIQHQTSYLHASSSIQESYSASSFSVMDSVSTLLPDWEVLVVVSPETPPSSSAVFSGEKLSCLYPNNATSPARFSGVLPSTNQTTFTCELPRTNRRRLPFLAPRLTISPEKEPPVPQKQIARWNFIVYESFSTENDVVLFVKGVNHRQGINRSPQEFRCVFHYKTNNNAVVTAVTSSVQEVFRCHHPNLTALIGSGGEESNDQVKLKVSLEILNEKLVLPSVAYYTPWRKIASQQPKSELCACTMVYNVAKFLREWVMYHAKIGVEKFILYDNNGDDDLKSVVEELNKEGYKVETLLWVWPKTQEAGFSHAALYAKDSCTWMMFVDVDEFVFSPSWVNSLQPSDHMLKSLLPKKSSSLSLSLTTHRRLIGQVMIKCNEFGPSNQRSHPVEGVTQGYNCRRRQENRHKSIVLLDAIDDSLLNVIHHFALKGEKYRWKQLSLEVAVVNHYKYQAWSEFKAKFRRRVSAYVADWTRAVNPSSKDRTPGLGFEPIEPSGWEQKFCEVRDEQLKVMTQRWFGTQVGTGYKMAWQR